MSAGIQYLKFRELKHPSQNYNRKAAFLNLALQGKIKGKNVGMLGFLNYETEDRPRDVGGSYKNTTIAVKLFLL